MKQKSILQFASPSKEGSPSSQLHSSPSMTQKQQKLDRYFSPTQETCSVNEEKLSKCSKRIEFPGSSKGSGNESHSSKGQGRFDESHSNDQDDFDLLLSDIDDFLDDSLENLLNSDYEPSVKKRKV